MTIMHSQYREPGVPVIDQRRCTQCQECVRTCPADVLGMDNGRVVVRNDSLFGCVACGHCMMVCREGSITVTGRGLLSGDLMALPPAETKASSESLAALMAGRRSVRRFRDEEVAPDILDRVVEMAASAPMGIPPWDVGCVIVRGRERVQHLAAEIIKGYEGFLRIFRPAVLALMRPFIGRAAYEQFRYFIRPLAQMLVNGRKQGRDVLFWDAPAVMLFHYSPYASVVDATIACTYAMLAAESFGLGTTIIGSAGPILQRDKALSRAYGIPQGNRPADALILGHPAVTFKRGIRRRFASVQAV
jgi:NAD-dependent dihydropyrimidine dehydrogenase PreA subunit/nitroreductase